MLSVPRTSSLSKEAENPLVGGTLPENLVLQQSLAPWAIFIRPSGAHHNKRATDFSQWHT